MHMVALNSTTLLGIGDISVLCQTVWIQSSDLTCRQSVFYPSAAAHVFVSRVQRCPGKSTSRGCKWLINTDSGDDSEMI